MYVIRESWVATPSGVAYSAVSIIEPWVRDVQNCKLDMSNGLHYFDAKGKVDDLRTCQLGMSSGLHCFDAKVNVGALEE